MINGEAAPGVRLEDNRGDVRAEIVQLKLSDSHQGLIDPRRYLPTPFDGVGFCGERCVQAKMPTIATKGFARLRRAVSMVVRTSASA
jgi:hypothetical protein